MSRLDIVGAYLSARWRARTLHGALLRDWQDARVRTLVDHVRARSAYHRQHWQGLPTSEWRSFPVVDKAQMMAGFDQFTTIGVTRDDAMRIALDAESRRDFGATVGGCTVGLSSGTSGHRGLFLVSPDEQTRWAGTILARAIPDLRPGHRVAFFLRANSRLYERTSSIVQFRFFDLMQPVAASIAQLREFRPRLIVGPPSLLGMLADAKVRGEPAIAPSRLISVAEVLEPQDRARLESVFQAPVGEVYQCTEGLVAVTCRRGTLHVQEDVMVVQADAVTSTDPTRVSPVVTDVWRRTQPIIRYRLGDVLRLDERPCACGTDWRRIAAVEGRQDDLCWFPQSDDTLRAVFPDTMRRMVLLADARITEYRVEQHEAGAVRIQVEVSEPTAFGEIAVRIQQAVRDSLRDYECSATEVSVSEGLTRLLPGQKRRRVVCSWRERSPLPVVE